jgi:hypothetical protein
LATNGSTRFCQTRVMKPASSVTIRRTQGF